MFCPKCGTKNPENGKFCRTCGTDLSPVSDALAGKQQSPSLGFGVSIQPIQPGQLLDKKNKSLTWESALGTSFTGLAFLIVAIILAVTGAANASKWWFWLLIPAFVMIGTGIAQIIQLKKYENRFSPDHRAAQPNPDLEPANTNFIGNSPASGVQSLPPTQTEYVAPPSSPRAETRYKTGDLAPPSVTEDTTRLLELNQEGETMTLPKK